MDKILNKYNIDKTLKRCSSNNFVKSCVAFYDEKGYLSLKQIEILNNIINEFLIRIDTPPRRNNYKTTPSWINNPANWDSGIMFDLDLYQ